MPRWRRARATTPGAAPHSAVKTGETPGIEVRDLKAAVREGLYGGGGEIGNAHGARPGPFDELHPQAVRTAQDGRYGRPASGISRRSSTCGGRALPYQASWAVGRRPKG